MVAISSKPSTVRSIPSAVLRMIRDVQFTDSTRLDTNSGSIVVLLVVTFIVISMHRG